MKYEADMLPGEFLRRLRKFDGKSLDDVAKRFPKGKGKGKTISKQALSLVERGEMSIPDGRVESFQVAYGMSREAAKLFRECLKRAPFDVVCTEREFLEVVKGWVHETRGDIFVIGGKPLPFRNQDIQIAVVNFLSRDSDNTLQFFYPSRYEDVITSPESRTSLFFTRNTRQDIDEVYRFIHGRALPTRPIESEQIQFHRIRVDTLDLSRLSKADLLLMQTLELCCPFMALIVVAPRSEEPIGYVLTEGGDKFSYTPLSVVNTRRTVSLITALKSTQDVLCREYSFHS